MAHFEYSSIQALEDNTLEMYLECTDVLVRIARNILQDPDNPKYRSISLGSSVVANKLLPASGAMQCLFDMGFKEASDKLVLPMGSPLHIIKHIHDELVRRRELKKLQNVESIVKPEGPPKPRPKKLRPRPDPIFEAIKHELEYYIEPMENDFFNSISYNVQRVWKCERTSLQLKALKCVPLPEIRRNVELNIRRIQKLVKKKQIEDQVVDSQELLLLELCKWYRTNFFRWVDIKCKKCHCEETKFVGKDTTDGHDPVEVYKCCACNDTILFPRYTDVEKLLETRYGRCGEWVHVFYLICRSLGWDVRYIVDETDHVWIEVFSDMKNKWIHCDPCENAIDAPLIYEAGWKKELSYIIAYSKDDIQDVSWRYSSNYEKLLMKRTKCYEEKLVEVICKIRSILLRYATDKRKEFVIKRTALELVDLLNERGPTVAEMQGRSSGSLGWRLARGEITLDQEFRSVVWEIDKHKENMEFKLSFCTSWDRYFLGSSNKIVEGWRNGLYQLDGIARKVEDDWKMTYLAREEGGNVGSLVWRFRTTGKFTISHVQVKIVRHTFENGVVSCELRTEEKSVPIPQNCLTFSTNEFTGSNYVELSVVLSGGTGDRAWQHAQIFRQSLEDRARTFEVVIGLTEIRNHESAAGEFGETHPFKGVFLSSLPLLRVYAPRICNLNLRN